MSRETFLERRLRRCKHFTGLQRETCEAGVSYAAVKDTSQRPYRLPCLEPEARCEKREYPTREEAEAEEAEIQESMRRINVARQAIVAHTGGKCGLSGEIVCPVDGGTLRFCVAGVNGHIHAACSTKGCVSWME